MCKRKRSLLVVVIIGVFMFFAMLIVLCYYWRDVGPSAHQIVAKTLYSLEHMENRVISNVTTLGELEISQQFLTVNEYSRPGRKLSEVSGIVIHYTGNPKTTAEGNRNYFQSLAYDKSNYASAHFVVGLEGEIIQCIPLDEEAFATRTRNNDTIGIEVCHPDAEGMFNEASYEKLVQLVAELCKKYELTDKDVLRHYDVTGKICPKYYVENEDAWEQMKEDIREEINRKLEAQDEEHINCR